MDFLIPSAYAVLKNTDAPYSPLTAKMVLPPLERFSAAAASVAPINMIPDSDGTLRWEMLAIKYQDDYYAPIGLQAARLYRNLDLPSLALDGQGSVQMADTVIPTDAQSRMLINYRGPDGTFPRVFDLRYRGRKDAGRGLSRTRSS